MADVFIPSIRTFQVFPDLPEPLAPLLELAQNFWWVWQPDAVELFRRLDRRLWESVYHNPIKLLGQISQYQLGVCAEDDGYLAHLQRVYTAFQAHLKEPGWFATQHPDDKPTIAYFSAEFGLHESLPIYSGGLGILAGDHLKSASELGLPLVAVGLLYRNGYFQQYLSSDGWQQEAYPELDFYNLAVEQQKGPGGTPLRVKVDLPDGPVLINIWKASVGRIPLLLLDTNLPENSPPDRDITARLYGGGHETRIQQEIVLGIGGTRALAAVGITPTVFHMNEGHSAFLALERTRVLLEQHPTFSFDQVRMQVMASNVFTTHTPVPAGIDMFPVDLMDKYFRSFYPHLKLDQDGFLSLGRENVFDKKQGFSMAVLAIRLADGVNGVSALHGDVSRHMWHNLWPAVPPAEVPIRSVTNGIHVRTWLAPDLAFTLERYLGDNWLKSPADHSDWDDISQIPDEELWRAHERCKQRLVSWTRHSLREQLSKRGGSFDDLTVADEVLDPEALTIGFARRFATYKRGALLLRDPERLIRLLGSTTQPIQFVFAGKAHPADNDGKELIRAIVSFARDHPGIRRRMVFVENYDMNVARYLVQGVDVWLNTPRRPYEASGTSGMKAAANGIPNCSILDGWWVEGYNPDVGWAIGRGEDYADPNLQDQVESMALYDLLEKQIIPEFYRRGVDNLPREWIGRMKNCMRQLAPVFNTNRMVRDYAEQFYVPAFRRGTELAANHLARAVQLAHTKDNLRFRWPNIKITGVSASGDGHYKVGQTMQVQATLELPDINPDEVTVQLYSGTTSAAGQLEKASASPMEHARELSPGKHLFTGTIACQTSGRQGFAVRVLPGDGDLATPFEPGLILWN